jgi:hypothetical protein
LEGSTEFEMIAEMVVPRKQGDQMTRIASVLSLVIVGLLALPAAAVLSVLVRFAYNRYLAEHPELRPAKSGEQNAPAGEAI